MSDDVTWITVNGAHVPVKEGQDKGEAIKAHFKAAGQKAYADKQAKKEAAAKAVSEVNPNARPATETGDMLRKADRASNAGKRSVPLSRLMESEPPGGWTEKDAVGPTKESQARMTRIEDRIDSLLNGPGRNGAKIGNLAQQYANERKQVGRA